MIRSVRPTGIRAILAPGVLAWLPPYVGPVPASYDLNDLYDKRVQTLGIRLLKSFIS
jgi:hypothetical protein